MYSLCSHIYVLNLTTMQTIKKKSDHQASTTTDSSDTTNGTDTEIVRTRFNNLYVSRR